MFPKEGNDFPASKAHATVHYAASIAAALHGELGHTHRATKTVMRWTGASERAVKNWFAGSKGPSGEHLVLLLRQSDMVLQVVLSLAGRERTISAIKLAGIRHELLELLERLHGLLD
jgi:hypothetical protein